MGKHINININFPDNSLLTQNIQTIMATQTELAEQLTTVAQQVSKIGTETTVTLQKVGVLEEALANQDNVSPELQAAFDALKQQVQFVDDLVPDAPTPPAEEPVNP